MKQPYETPRLTKVSEDDPRVRVMLARSEVFFRCRGCGQMWAKEVTASSVLDALEVGDRLREDHLRGCAGPCDVPMVQSNDPQVLRIMGALSVKAPRGAG